MKKKKKKKPQKMEIMQREREHLKGTIILTSLERKETLHLLK